MQLRQYHNRCKQNSTNLRSGLKGAVGFKKDIFNKEDALETDEMNGKGKGLSTWARG